MNEVGSSLVKILAVDFPEHVVVNQVVRVEDHHQVVPILIVADGFQRFLQGDGLSGRSVFRLLPGLDHVSAETSGFFRRSVRAVIGNDIEIV